MTTPLIVGIGSHHGDDQVGWRVAEELERNLPPAAAVRLASTPADLLNWLDGIDLLLVCDGCRGSGAPGHARRWSWPNIVEERLTWSGTHNLGLIETLSLAERLGHLPFHVAVWTVEMKDTGIRGSMSAEVAAAV